MSNGSRRQLVFVPESTYGVQPATPTMVVLRNTGGGGISVDRSGSQSAEFNANRQINGLRLGVPKVTLDVPFEFSALTYDQFIESALFGAFALKVPVTITGLTLSVDSSLKTITRSAGSWITDGWGPGDTVVTTAFANSGNNGTFTILSLTATVLTLVSTTTGLVTESNKAGCTASTTTRQVKSGTTMKSFTIEEGYADIAQFLPANGMIVNQLQLSIKPDAIVTGSLAIVGSAVGTMAGATIANTTTQANTNPAFDSFTGSIKEGGTTIAIVTGISLTLTNGADPKYAVFSKNVYRMAVGRSNLTGTINAFFENATLLNKFLNETESSLELNLTDPLGNTYSFVIPRIKYTGGKRSLTENDVQIELPFQALLDPVSNTNFIVKATP